MASDVFTFHWTVPESGYQWKYIRGFTSGPGGEGTVGHQSQVEDKPHWFLTDGLTPGEPYRMKRYDPLKVEPGLFRNFARVPPKDRDAILAFANQYGNLGVVQALYELAPNEPGRLLGIWGEKHQEWAQHIDQMQRAVAIWDKVQAGDVAGLSRFIRWRRAGGTGYWAYDSHPDLPRIEVVPPKASPPPPGRHSQLIESVEGLFKPDDVFTPARFLVQRWVNAHLKDRASPHLLYQLEYGTQVLQIVPHNLLGAMWLQFAHAIAGNKKHRSCKECGKWIEISSEDDGRSARRMFCSDSCKFRDYRRRKDRAQRLKAEGKPVKAIAKELDTDVETIKKWLTKRKG
jgi:hypothetical protein